MGNKIKTQHQTSIAQVHLFQSWVLFLQNLLRPHYEILFSPPLFIPQEYLRDAKYFDHFPHQLFKVSGIKKSTMQYINPAACLHVYPELRGKNVESYSTFVTAHCARFEDGLWQEPYRLADFHMSELVVVGNLDIINNKLIEIKLLLQNCFNDFGFGGHFENATDAFFLGESEGAKMIQKLKGLKQEYVVQSDGKDIALASINNHEEFFGGRFNISTSDSTANSMCVAFGIERLVAFSLETWGADMNNWPKGFTKYVKVSQ